MSDSPDHSAGLRTLLPRLWAHLSPTRRWQIGVSLLVMIASGLAEIVSLAALVPFLGVLADPARFWQEPRIRGFAEALGYSAPGQLLLPRTLHQPYLVHVARNSSTITAAMISYVHGVLNPLLLIVANVILAVAITARLFSSIPGSRCSRSQCLAGRIW